MSNARPSKRSSTIVSIDEIDLSHNRVSWVSPIASALMKGAVGDVVTLRTPCSSEEFEIVEIRYDELT